MQYSKSFRALNRNTKILICYAYIHVKNNSQGIIDMAIKNRPKDPELLHIRGKLQVCMLARAPPKQLPYGLKKHFELADKDLEKVRAYMNRLQNNFIEIPNICPTLLQDLRELLMR